MDELGVTHGRFQVLHNDHLEYILAGKRRCSHLVIGITNPDPAMTRADETNPARSLESSNPLTYFERYMMVKAALVEKGLNYSEFSITPFPINFPDLYRYYVPVDAVYYITIYDQWGRRKHELLTKSGLKTEVLWDRPPEQKGLTGSFIRSLMMKGLAWEEFVPASVARLMTQWDIPTRIRNIHQQSATTSC